MLRTGDFHEPLPWYRGFKGSISQLADGKYETKGIVDVVSNCTVRISELPIGVWIDDFKVSLEKLLDAGKIKAYSSQSTDVSVLFDVTLTKPCDDLHSLFGLVTNKTTTNMYAFDANGYIKKYNSVVDMLREFADVRLEVYAQRRNALLQDIAFNIETLENKIKFIQYVNSHSIKDLKRDELVSILEELQFAKRSNTFDYLLRLPVYSLTLDKVDELQLDLQNALERRQQIFACTPRDMWMTDLDHLQKIMTN
jgi:DNA topoisomerase-2